MKAKKEHWTVEVTDTFGGCANYAWVRRYAFEVKAGASRLAIVRAAKRAANMNGSRGRIAWYDDNFDFRPSRECVVLFARFVGEV